jgi:hypothetical protein
MGTAEIQFLLDYQKKERPAARRAFGASLGSLLGRPILPRGRISSSSKQTHTQFAEAATYQISLAPSWVGRYRRLIRRPNEKCAIVPKAGRTYPGRFDDWWVDLQILVFQKWKHGYPARNLQLKFIVSYLLTTC